MNIQHWSVEPRVSILIKIYPTYRLYGRLAQSNLEEYRKTHNDKLLLYKFCENVYDFTVPDYKAIMDEQTRKSKEAHLKHRLAIGFKST